MKTNYNGKIAIHNLLSASSFKNDGHDAFSTVAFPMSKIKFESSSKAKLVSVQD